MNPWSRLIFNRANAAYVCAGALLLWTPPNYLLENKLVAWLGVAAQNLFPVIQKYSAISNFSVNTAAFLSFAYLTSPIVFILVWRSWKSIGLEAYTRAVMRERTHIQKRQLLLGLPFLILVFASSLFFMAGDPSFCKSCASDNRIGMLLLTDISLILLAGFARGTYWFYLNKREIFAEGEMK